VSPVVKVVVLMRWLWCNDA